MWTDFRSSEPQGPSRSLIQAPNFVYAMVARLAMRAGFFLLAHVAWAAQDLSFVLDSDTVSSTTVSPILEVYPQ
ncbi:hypothetical protein AK812_SmicGene28776 [Symbiodinium microadriaticum]|uniref:Uncharacterized protein n=1 Tax=Symbiodinium microadriaticum TaxID=2951 RepID=A0A1Q9D3H9_SYMMI|nr:hypothetical protein AK812_SmicGene28776 [Symbiodinium microadriaticum]